MKKLIIGIAILAIAVMSQAQRGMGFGGGGVTMLLGREDVKADLALTSDQSEKLAALNDRDAMMAAFQQAMKDAGISDFSEMRTPEGQKKMAPIFEKMQADMRKKVDAILTPDQSKRLDQINVQFNGNRSVTQKDVAKLIGLTEDQSKSIVALQKKQQDAMRGLYQKVQDGELTREDVDASRKKNDEILDSEIGKLLTEPQKAKLKEMGGKKFERKDEN
jgi:predicted transglutaminase-like cysteine proteinase